MNQHKLFSLSLCLLSAAHIQSADTDMRLDRANQLFSTAQYTQAIPAYKEFLQTGPANPDAQVAQVNLAQCLIAEGLDTNNPALWQEAWPLFEQRISLEKRAALQNPLTCGMDVNGKVIKVKAEYGFGDDVTFAPLYCEQLRKLGATVVLELPGIHRLLASLLTRSEGISRVITQHTPADQIPTCDHEVYLMSLPGFISSNAYEPTTEFAIPKLATPGIKADAELVKTYQAQMESTKLHLGVCWRASKNAVAGGTRIIDRNLPLRILTQMAENEGYIKLWSVQGPPDKFVTESEFSRLEHQGQVGNINHYLDVIPDRHAALITQVADEKDRPFENTAAVIGACDAFAGCDTVFPNLAAAMGTKTYFMLKQEQVDMRWGNTRGATPWFADAVALRQETPGNWDSPIAQLTAALKNLKIAKNTCSIQ